MALLPEKLPQEAKSRVGVLIALACSGRLITPEMVLAMAMQPNPTHFAPAYQLVKGLPVAEAREALADIAVDIGAKFLWFVDDDTIPPPNTLRRLIYVLENYPEIGAVGGVYVTKSDPPQPVVFRGPGLGSFWHWKKGEIFEVTSMGAGCLLINTKVFSAIPKPWFSWDEQYSADPHHPSALISEDVGFCNKIRAKGYSVFAHGGILCDHFDCHTGITYQMPADSYPMRTDTVSMTYSLPPGADSGILPDAPVEAPVAEPATESASLETTSKDNQ